MILHDAPDKTDMKNSILFLIAALLIVLLPNTVAFAQQHSLGAFADQSDVGNPVRAGGAT